MAIGYEEKARFYYQGGKTVSIGRAIVTRAGLCSRLTNSDGTLFAVVSGQSADEIEEKIALLSEGFEWIRGCPQ